MLLCWMELLLGQSTIRLQGQVFDAQTGEPLRDVLIEVEDSRYYAYSNEEGRFFIENITPGHYVVRFSALGYQPHIERDVVVRREMPTVLAVRLKSRPLAGDSVVVISHPTDFREQAQTRPLRIISSDKISEMSARGLGQLLQTVPGVDIESPQGEGSGSRVRIHGSRPQQVLILLDGQRLNNPQTGEVDLSRIPVEQIEKIEISLQGDAARYGSNAYAGVLNFQTKKRIKQDQLKVQAETGSFGFVSGRVGCAFKAGDLRMFAHFKQNYSRQNFPYHYQGKELIRENAYFRNRDYFAKLMYQWEALESSLLLSGGDSHRGVPSPFFNEYNDHGAYLVQEHLDLLFHQKYLSSAAWYVEWSAGLNRLDQEFNNEKDPVSFTRYRNKQLNETAQIDFKFHWQPAENVFLNSGLQYFREYLNHTDLLYPTRSMGEHARSRYAAYQNLEWQFPAVPYLWKYLSFQPSFRFEKYFGEAGQGYPSLNVALKPDFFPHLTLHLSTARAVRYPSFNSLFWAGDARSAGNPELNPERKETIGFGFNFSEWNASQPDKHWYLPQIYFYRFFEEITDLIYWQRGVNGVWQPRNLLNAENTGWDLSLEQNLLPQSLDLSIAYHRMEARNRSGQPTTDGKRIVFVPPYTVNISLSAEGHGFQGSVHYRVVGSRETVAANSRGTELDAYRLMDVSFGYRMPIGRYRLDLSLNLKNLSDSDYQLIYGYPMPGRNFRLALSANRVF